MKNWTDNPWLLTSSAMFRSWSTVRTPWISTRGVLFRENTWMESKGVANPIVFAYQCSIDQIIGLKIQIFGPIWSYSLLGVEKSFKMWSKLSKISKSRNAQVTKKYECWSVSRRIWNSWICFPFLTHFYPILTFGFFIARCFCMFTTETQYEDKISFCYEVSVLKQIIWSWFPVPTTNNRI